MFIKESIKILQEEGVLLYPTATVWGLGCSPFSEKAVERIYEIKQRERSKPLIVLVKDAEQLQKYTGTLPKEVLEVAMSKTPTSIVYPTIKGIPNFLLAENGSLAIRITKYPFCDVLIEKSGEPLVSTSANIANEPTPTTLLEVSDEIIEAVDYVVPSLIEEINPLSGISSQLFLLNKEDNSLSVLRS